MARQPVERHPSPAKNPTHSASNPAKSFNKRAFALKALLGAAITGGLFALLFQFVPPADVWKVLRRMRPEYYAIGLGIWVAMYLVRTVRFVLLAPRTPFVTMLAIASVHNFFVRLLPMRTGELSYAFLLRRAGTAGIGESLLGLLLLRLLDATMVVIMFSIMLLVDRGVYQGDRTSGMATAGIGVLVCLLLVLFLVPLLRLGHRLALAVTGKLGLDRNRRVSRLLDKVSGAVEQFSSVGPRMVLALSAVSALLWILTFSAFFAIMRGFSMPVGYAQTVLGATASVVTGFLPISGIGSFGTQEAGWAFGFALVGLDHRDAVSTGIGVGLTTFSYCALLGLLGWIVLTVIARKQKKPPG